MKIGLFHFGSGLADIIATGVWNRVMISDLGFSATPIGLLVALRYFLAPLGIWAGRVSDRRTIFGYRRLFWVWSGRAMMVISVLALGLITADLARGAPADALRWGGIVVSLLLFSLGSAFSGGTFLALIYDRSAPSQRGRAVGIVWTFLLLGYAVGGPVFGILLPHSEEGGLSFSPDTLQTLFIVAALVMGGLWFVSLFREERRNAPVVAAAEPAVQSSSMIDDLRLAWRDRQTRLFFWYLALSMLFAFSQDLILEPFAGDVFGMEARVTTRFSGYWGSMAILGSLTVLFLSTRYKWLSNRRMNVVGVGLLIVTFALFALSSLAEIRGLVTPGLILLGLGLGIWEIGTLGMMMQMSPSGRAGTFLGFWSLVVTVARGIGVSTGGIVRDTALQISGSLPQAYGVAFVLGAVGLAVALAVLLRIRAAQTSNEPAEPAAVLAGALD
ncbi:MAG: BCD family MFS transporter [Anaerolineae bacterium]|nr:BCD family MFS transporter [Anaerolineae bacterium]